MESKDELPDIPDIPIEESANKRRMSNSSDTDKNDRARSTQASKRPNVRPSTSRPGRYDKAKEWLDESPIRDRSVSRSGKQRIPHTTEERNARKEANKIQTAAARRRETAAETNERNEANRLQTAAARNQETAAETNARRESMRIRNAATRNQETDNETNARNEANRLRTAAARNQETAAETNARNEANRLQTAAGRHRNRTHVNLKDAARTKAVLDGAIEVPKLCDTADSIGSMTYVCEFCGALKFKREPPGTCCGNGKVVLTPFPPPPQPLLDLFIGQDEDARIFRKNARSINNAVCLTSLKNHWQPRQGGWQPSVIFQGRVQTRVGPLLPSP